MIFHKPLGLIAVKAEPTRNELLQEQRLQDFATTRLELSFRRAAAKIIDTTAHDAATLVDANGPNAGMLELFRDFNADMLGAYEKQYRRVAETFAADFVEGIEKSMARYETKDQAGIFEAFLVQFIDSFAADQVQHVEDTTRLHINNAIAQGIEENLPPREMAKLIVLKAGGVIARARADVISRTETHTAAQFGQQAAADSTGLQFRKYWVAVDDERTRDAHDEADTYSRANIIKNSEAFPVGGEMLMFPGDPSGSAENIIQCRCAVARRVLNEQAE